MDPFVNQFRVEGRTAKIQLEMDTEQIIIGRRAMQQSAEVRGQSVARQKLGIAKPLEVF